MFVLYLPNYVYLFHYFLNIYICFFHSFYLFFNNCVNIRNAYIFGCINICVFFVSTFNTFKFSLIVFTISIIGGYLILCLDFIIISFLFLYFLFISLYQDKHTLLTNIIYLSIFLFITHNSDRQNKVLKFALIPIPLLVLLLLLMDYDIHDTNYICRNTCHFSLACTSIKIPMI